MIKDELGDKKNDYRLIVASCLIQLFVFAQRFKEQPKPKHHTIGKIALYISENFQQPLSLKGLAERFFMNKSYLSRAFKEVTSFTIVEFLHMQRVKKACQLLSRSSLNVSRISEAVGFESITYFERVFKKYMGVSPLKYRWQNE